MEPKDHHPLADGGISLFSPTPENDYYPIRFDMDNTNAHKEIRQGLFLESVKSGATIHSSAFDFHLLLFCTTWEPYSASAIGIAKKLLDAGLGGRIGIVFFESSVDEIKSQKKDSWYFDITYVLGSESSHLKNLIGRTPIFVAKNEAGAIIIRDGL